MSSGSTTTPAYCFNSHGYLIYWQQETEKAEKVDFDVLTDSILLFCLINYIFA
jgi:hypothetical protein